MRRFRGFIYRLLPAGCFRKKIAGFERRWNLEEKGFTKEGFFRIFGERFHVARAPGLLLELAVGDGLVGSLGLWLEKDPRGWKVSAWEHRPQVLGQLRRNRPATEIHEGRLTCWEESDEWADVAAITTRGAREAAGVCRAIHQGTIRPQWLGIWNPSRRPVWYQRLRRENYRLELVWQHMEFYVDRRQRTEDGCRKPGVG